VNLFFNLKSITYRVSETYYLTVGAIGTSGTSGTSEIPEIYQHAIIERSNVFKLLSYKGGICY